MKRIEVIIGERWLQEINSLLKEANVGGMSYYRIQGRSREKVTEFVSKFNVMVIVNDVQVEELIRKIENKTRELSINGKLFVSDVAVAIDLATGSRGEEAI